ncbi:putative non-specific serine/threonine protein kinase [Medicago truncatula]|nr:putative non-specific serine/threonine protein kinase [Medicago truncatula]
MVALFKKCYNEGVIVEEMVDPFIKDSITSECLKFYCQMVLSCLHGDGNQRMSMSDVVGTLELALKLVMSGENSKFDATQEREELKHRLNKELQLS